jgi:hypothetical protein
VNQEIIRAKTLIAELKLNNETAHQLTRSIGNLLTVQRLLLEQIHRTHPILQAQSSVGRKSNNAVFAVNMTEEEPPKPPPDEDESKPPIKEPPSEEPPVKEPPPKNRQSGLLYTITIGFTKTTKINRGGMMAVELRESFVQIPRVTKIRILFLNLVATAAQRNDLAVPSHRLDRGSATLIRGSPIRGNIFGASDLGEFLLESIQPPKLFHSVL